MSNQVGSNLIQKAFKNEETYSPMFAPQICLYIVEGSKCTFMCIFFKQMETDTL